MQSAPTPSGIDGEVFVMKKEVWCSIFTLSTAQIIQLMGQEQHFSVSVLLRKLPNGLENFTHAQFQGKKYVIASYHPDADNSPKSFDMLELKEVKKND